MSWGKRPRDKPTNTPVQKSISTANSNPIRIMDAPSHGPYHFQSYYVPKLNGFRESRSKYVSVVISFNVIFCDGNLIQIVRNVPVVEQSFCSLIKVKKKKIRYTPSQFLWGRLKRVENNNTFHHHIFSVASTNKPCGKSRENAVQTRHETRQK